MVILHDQRQNCVPANFVQGVQPTPTTELSFQSLEDQEAMSFCIHKVTHHSLDTLGLLLLKHYFDLMLHLEGLIIPLTSSKIVSFLLFPLYILNCLKKACLKFRKLQPIRILNFLAQILKCIFM